MICVAESDADDGGVHHEEVEYAYWDGQLDEFEWVEELSEFGYVSSNQQADDYAYRYPQGQVLLSQPQRQFLSRMLFRTLHLLSHNPH